MSSTVKLITGTYLPRPPVTSNRVLMIILFSGMTWRDYQNIPSIQEVECWGGSVVGEAELLSLTIYKVPDNFLLAYANPLKKHCVIYDGFSSCHIDFADTRKSRLKILITDLKEDETRKYGCNITTFKTGGITNTQTSIIFVKRTSKYHLLILSPKTVILDLN